jgi:hypothetical protein
MISRKRKTWDQSSVRSPGIELPSFDEDITKVRIENEKLDENPIELQ